MKTSKKVIISILIIVAIVISFFAGRYVTQVENTNTRKAQCSTLIGFAIDKTENGDLADQGTMRALISNVYAAYQCCDNPTAANQLHDLWNFLIFESDGNLESAKDVALHELNDALRAVKTDG